MTHQSELGGPAYLLAAILVVVPAFDAIMSVAPVRLGDPHWRFAAFGLLSNGTIIPLLGVLIALMVAGAFDQRRVQRWIGFLLVACSVAMCALLVLFVLDALQTRAILAASATARLAFGVATITACVKWLLAIVTSAVFAQVALRGTKAPELFAPQPLPQVLHEGSLFTAKPATGEDSQAGE